MRGLQAKFEEFRQNIEPTENQIEKIIGSHKHLRENILHKLNYVKNTILIGSYKRKTLIRPLNDVDVFVVLNYPIMGAPTPKDVLYAMKKDLITSYPLSEIMIDKPCVVIDFSHCKFELTPVIELSIGSESGYFIPEKSDNQKWIKIEDPDILGVKLTKANQQLNLMLIPLIKMMKRCKQHNNLKNMKSYMMELLAIEKLTKLSNYRDGVQQLLRIYNWIDLNGFHQISQLSDEQFAEYCTTNIFGSDFPKN